MKTQISDYLRDRTDMNPASLILPEVSVDTEQIRAVMINEVAPSNPNDDFYGTNNPPDYMTTTIPLFRSAGVEVGNISDILNMGIYITNAVKTPKTEYTIQTETVRKHAALLDLEISLFPNLNVIMLMGDVAKKAMNMITKAKTGKNVIPSGSTYKIRNTPFRYGDIRIIPSYIMTGGSILIEQFKRKTIAEDIATMMTLIK